MSGIGAVTKARRSLSAGVAVAVLLGLAALFGLTGCGDGAESVTTTYAAGQTTAAPAEPGRGDTGGFPPPDGDFAVDGAAPAPNPGQAGGSLAALQTTSGQKIITDGLLEIEVEKGKFETAFDQALLLADRYGGYLVNSSSHATGEEQGMKSGTVAIRVPAASFPRALADAGKLGEVRHRQIQSHDVTEEYVDLQARITNSKAHVQALLTLLAKAEKVDEILQVQQVLTAAQQQLEELQGRLRYLDEHTSYSTLTLTMYESGAVILTSTQWGFTAALKDALHNLVAAVNTIIRGLGALVPVLVVLAIIAYIVYRVWLAAARRRREREHQRYQPYPQGWQSVHPGSPSAAQAAAVPPPAAGEGSAPAEPEPPAPGSDAKE